MKTKKERNRSLKFKKKIIIVYLQKLLKEIIDLIERNRNLSFNIIDSPLF